MRRWFVVIFLGCMLIAGCGPKQQESRVQGAPHSFSPISFEKNHTYFERQSADNMLKKRSKNTRKLSFDVRAQEKQAKFADIPVPMQAQPIKSFFDESDVPDGIIIGYTSSLSDQDLTQFYYQEMERLGWRCTARCESVESFLYFEKPARFCSVSIRPVKSMWGSSDTTIVVCSGYKKSS